MRRKILATLDGSKTSESVVPYLEALLRTEDVDVTLSHVALHDGTGIEEIRGYLNEVASMLEAKGASVRIEILKGNPPVAIVNEALDGGYQMIAMCTRGKTGLKRLLLGSVAEEVLRRSPIPVLIVHPREPGEAAPQVRRIVVPLDGTHVAANILPAVAEMAETMGAKVGFVSVVSPTRKEVLPVEVVAENIFREQKMLQRRGIDVELAVLYGDPAKETVEFAERNKADLVALCTHGRRGLDRFLYGSVAETILRTTRIPLLVARAAARQKVHVRRPAPGLRRRPARAIP